MRKYVWNADMLCDLAARGGYRIIVPEDISLTKPIRPASHTTIEVEEGATIAAARGAFKSKGDYSGSQPNDGAMLDATGVVDIHIDGGTWIGIGETANAADSGYEPSEHRHNLSFRGCQGVTLNKVVSRYAGGDGFYFGLWSADGTRNPSVTIAMDECLASLCGRQGMSLASAVEFKCIHSEFYRNGTTYSPRAGIAIEPVHPKDFASRIVIEDCYIEHSTGWQWYFNGANLTEASQPVSVDLRRMRIVCNPDRKEPFMVNGFQRSQTVPPGYVQFEDVIYGSKP